MRSLSVLALVVVGCSNPAVAPEPEPEITPGVVLDPSPFPPSQVAPPVSESNGFQSDPSLEPVPAEVLPTNHATGSSTMALSEDGAVYTVNPDAGSITRTLPDTGAVLEVPVGAEPSRIAVHADRVYVSLRGERRVVVLDAAALADGPIGSVEVGAEPVGMVMRGDGTRLYVAVSQAHTVVELDAQSLEVLRSFAWDSGEPRYLGLSPDGMQLFVGFGRGTAGVSHVALDSGAAMPLLMPATNRPFTNTGPTPLSARVTGDLWVDDGGVDRVNVLIPTVYLDTTTPVTALSSVEEIEDVSDTGGDPFAPGGGYASDGMLDTVTPALAEVVVSPSGGVYTMRALFAELSLPTSEPDVADRVGSYLSGATSNGVTYAASVEASGAVVLFDPDTEPFEILGFDPFLFGTESELMPVPTFFVQDGGFEVVQMAALEAGNGVSGVRITGSRVFANAAFDQALVEVDAAEGLTQMAIDPFIVAPERAEPLASWSVANATLPADVLQGRELFYMARGATMGGSGVSCSTCHFEGRNDGITWTFDDGPRQTPSLAGVVSETAPVTWRSNVPTVQDEAEITTLGRLGGSELTTSELDAIAAFVDWTPIPDLPTPDPEAVDRGAEQFVAAGCSGCHAGPRHTDLQMHAIRGVTLDTPSLTGVAATGPWLHDGSAHSLRDVLDLAMSGEMGSAAGMTDAELDDLEAYLRSL